MAASEKARRASERRLNRKVAEDERAREAAPPKPPGSWLDKRGLAAYFSCSVSWVEKRMQEGMPHAIIAGRAKFKPAECETWLEANGRLTRKGGEA